MHSLSPHWQTNAVNNFTTEVPVLPIIALSSILNTYFNIDESIAHIDAIILMKKSNRLNARKKNVTK